MLHEQRRRPWLSTLTFALVLTFALHPSLAATAAAQCPPAATHTVRPGETLSGIAGLYGVTVAALVQANGLADPNRIEAGQRLIIPGCAGAPPAPAPGAPTGTGQVVHVVQPGETLSAIAARYGVPIDAIVRANGLADPNRIEAGQRLVIPTGGAAAAPPAAPGTAARGPKRIEVDLSRQWVYAYEGGVLVLSSGVSTGRPGWETPAGRFAIYAKLPVQTMSGNVNGEAWHVPDVPHVMYFYRNAALHGTYWHNAFGTGARLSHGCVNLPLRVAEWLYHWAPVGTPVWVHY